MGPNFHFYIVLDSPKKKFMNIQDLIPSRDLMEEVTFAVTLEFRGSPYNFSIIGKPIEIALGQLFSSPNMV